MNFDNYCFPPERERISRFARSQAAVVSRRAAAIPPRNCLANFRKFIAVFHIIQSYRRRSRYYCWKAILSRFSSSCPFFFLLSSFLFFPPPPLFFFLFNIELLAPRVIFGGVVSAIVTKLSYNSTRAL